MKEPIDNGGPAFPIPRGQREFWDCEEDGSPNGMTLRDYFAAAALQGLLAWPGDNVCGNAHTNATYDQVAASVFAIADAMLAARKEKR
jgi:hypothetical protein